MVAVILIGFGAALFSPAMDAALAFYGTRLTGVTRQDLFALDALFSRVGELVGPVLGTLLIPLGFPVVAVAGAGLFTVIFILHLAITPAIETPTKQSALTGFQEVFSNRKFLFSPVHTASTWLGTTSFTRACPLKSSARLARRLRWA